MQQNDMFYSMLLLHSVAKQCDGEHILSLFLFYAAVHHLGSEGVCPSWYNVTFSDSAGSNTTIMAWARRVRKESAYLIKADQWRDSLRLVHILVGLQLLASCYNYDNNAC